MLSRLLNDFFRNYEPDARWWERILGGALAIARTAVAWDTHIRYGGQVEAAAFWLALCDFRPDAVDAFAAFMEEYTQ